MPGLRPLNSKLFIVGKSFKRHGQQLWRCLCDCGGFIDAQINSVLRSATKSCGCLRRESCRKTGKRKRYDVGVSVRNNAYTTARRKAKSRGLEFLLTKEQFHNIVESNCYYCGSHPFRKFKGAKGLVRCDYVCNGIDRVDSSIGYTVNNCVASCRPCNVAKSDMTQLQFLEMIKKIYSNISARNNNATSPNPQEKLCC